MEFDRANHVVCGFSHVVHPIKWGADAWSFIANPIPHLGMVGVCGRVLGDSNDNDFPVAFIGCMEAHP